MAPIQRSFILIMGFFKTSGLQFDNWTLGTFKKQVPGLCGKLRPLVFFHCNLYDGHKLKWEKRGRMKCPLRKLLSMVSNQC